MAKKKNKAASAILICVALAAVAVGGYFGYSFVADDIDGNRNNGAWGDGGWLWIIVVFALLFGWGGNGFVGFGGGNFGRDGYPYATQADVRSAVDQQTLISKLDQQTYGLADTFTALNNTLNSNFRGIDNAICTLGYQN